eukprot:TRINITY_DN10196_c0_g1_i1.p1 TRINITY_DN10196_c0_g1~~TRINITY_DN10196_c0_g1_i1.p1  ORF type:complete len:574 (+),score=113.05 TRINITY_DN10196_c0_g1_i1:248-1969(+)
MKLISRAHEIPNLPLKLSRVPGMVDRVEIFEGDKLAVRAHLFQNATETTIHDHGQSFISFCLRGKYNHTVYTVDQEADATHFETRRKPGGSLLDQTEKKGSIIDSLAHEFWPGQCLLIRWHTKHTVLPAANDVATIVFRDKIKAKNYSTILSSSQEIEGPTGMVEEELDVAKENSIREAFKQTLLEAETLIQEVDPWRNDRQPDVNFFGRDEEMNWINRALSRRKRAAIVQFGGAGKTELVCQYAYRNRYRYPSGVYWLQADSRSEYENSLVKIGERLHCISNRDALEYSSDEDSYQGSRSFDRRIAQVVFRELKQQSSPWLLCIDNCDDSELLDLIASSLPRESRGHFILTSRCLDSVTFQDLDIDEENLLQLRMLDKKTASRLLFRRARNKLSEHFNVDELIEALPKEEKEALSCLVGGEDEWGLDGLPLALQQAAGYMCSRGKSFVDYLNYLKAYNFRVFQNQSPKKALRGKERSSVATTWKMNIQELSEENTFLIRLLSCFHPDNIPRPFVEHIIKTLYPCDPFAFDNLIMSDLVQGSCLVQSHSDSFSIHRLIRKAIWESITDGPNHS